MTHPPKVTWREFWDEWKIIVAFPLAIVVVLAAIGYLVGDPGWWVPSRHLPYNN